MSTRSPTATRATAAFDVARVRERFPALAQQVRGQPLVYLDNAATTQKPRRVIDAVAGYYERDNANVHRGVHLLSERATAAYEAARDRVQRFLNAADRREIVFVRGATEGDQPGRPELRPDAPRPGDEVLVSTMEHHSNIVPWQIVCAADGRQPEVDPDERPRGAAPRGVRADCSAPGRRSSPWCTSRTPSAP